MIAATIHRSRLLLVAVCPAAEDVATPVKVDDEEVFGVIVDIFMLREGVGRGVDIPGEGVPMMDVVVWVGVGKLRLELMESNKTLASAESVALTETMVVEIISEEVRVVEPTRAR